MNETLPETPEPPSEPEAPPATLEMVKASAVQENLPMGGNRANEVSKALDPAYEKASLLVVTPEEAAALRQPFPDEVIEIRPFDGLIYIPHIVISNRLSEVFGPGAWSMIRRRDFCENQRIFAEWVMKVRGCFVGESIGAQDYHPNNPKTNLADAMEGTRGECLRRIAGKDLHCGDQVWLPRFAREWVSKHAIKVWCIKGNTGEKRPMWRRKDDPAIDLFPWREMTDRAPSKPVGASEQKQVSPEPHPAPAPPRPVQPPRRAEPEEELDFDHAAPAPPPVAPVKPKAQLKVEVNDDWKKMICPIPPKGMTRDEYMINPMTLGDMAEKDPKRFYGFCRNFVPSEWKGKLREGDVIFRQALDQACDYCGFDKPGT